MRIDTLAEDIALATQSFDPPYAREFIYTQNELLLFSAKIMARTIMEHAPKDEEFDIWDAVMFDEKNGLDVNVYSEGYIIYAVAYHVVDGEADFSTIIQLKGL